MVSGLYISIDQNKVAAVLLKPIPSTLKEMQSFLGFVSYYRRHIQNFGAVAACLYKLCSPSVVFEMTQERIQAYNTLKEKLTTAPILLHPE